MEIVLLFSSDCPNAEPARQLLRTALEQRSLPPSWKECQTDREDCPTQFKCYGSPTILIDGLDVSKEEAPSGACCRLYASPSQARLVGVPDLATILSRL